VDRTRAAIFTISLTITSGAAVGTPAQASGDGTGWTRQFGSPSPDEAQGLALDSTGNAYVVGWTSGTLPRQVSAGTVDAFVRKVDPAGSELWTSQFGSWDSDFAHAVAVDGSGDVYVVGETEGTLPDQQSAGGRDAFIRKYGPDGRERWTRQFGGRGGEMAAGVALDPAGHPYVVGTTAATLPDQTSAGSFDAFVRKYDGDGNEVWTRQFGSQAGDGARGVAVEPTGNLVVVGSTEGPVASESWFGGFDAYVRLYDPEGHALWTRQFGSPQNDYGVAVAVDPAGNPTVVGSTDGALPGESSGGGTEGFLRRFDPAGTALWTHQFGTGSADEGWGVAVDVASNTYVVGTTEANSPVQTKPPKTDCFARKYDPAGEELWVRQFGTEETDLAIAVALDSAGHPYVAGSTRGTLSGEQSQGERDAYVLDLN
jgi:beta-propeller repeat-containing protein